MTSMVRIAIGVATAALLAACGGGGDAGNGDTAGNGQAGGTTLTMVDNEFQPADLTASAGADIELVNDGQALHNLTADGIDQDVDAGGSTTVTLDLDPGEYEIVCKYHEAQGMVGTLTVE